MSSNVEAANKIEVLMLASNIYHRKEILELQGELHIQVRKLIDSGSFTKGEVAAVLGVSPYRLTKLYGTSGFSEGRGKLNPKHLDHLTQMVTNEVFAKKHISEVIQEGTNPGTIERLTGLTVARQKYWQRKEEKND